jgi:hypothetical protein
MASALLSFQNFVLSSWREGELEVESFQRFSGLLKREGMKAVRFLVDTCSIHFCCLLLGRASSLTLILVCLVELMCPS